jgi:hypothetical protein
MIVTKTTGEINQQLLQEPKSGRGLVSKTRAYKTWRPILYKKLNQKKSPLVPPVPDRELYLPEPL